MSLLGQLNRKYLLRYRLEYLVALVVVYGTRCLSPSYAWRVARSVGRLVWILGARRKVTLAPPGAARASSSGPALSTCWAVAAADGCGKLKLDMTIVAETP